MKLWVNLLKVIIIITGIIILSFNVLLYNFCERQRNEINTMGDQQKVESQVNTNKFKYQQDQIERISKDLEDAQQQIKDQNDALSGQKDESKSIQTSLVDIKAEADAIKQDMKGWQKDDARVLAEFEKGIDNIQGQIKSLHENLNTLNISELNQKINSLQDEVEKVSHPNDNTPPGTPPAPAKKDKDENQL